MVCVGGGWGGVEVGAGVKLIPIPQRRESALAFGDVQHNEIKRRQQ